MQIGRLNFCIHSIIHPVLFFHLHSSSFPALWPECLNIAAVAKKDELPVAYFSNTNPEVDYAGIGVDVVSFKPNGGTQKMSGKFSTNIDCHEVFI